MERIRFNSFKITHLLSKRPLRKIRYKIQEKSSPPPQNLINPFILKKLKNKPHLTWSLSEVIFTM